MKPIDVKSDSLAEYNEESNEKYPKFKVGDHVRVSKYKNIFAKGCAPKNSFACLFSVRNTISLSRHEQVCLMRLRFERYFSHHRANDGRSISRNVASLNILVHDVINLL